MRISDWSSDVCSSDLPWIGRLPIADIGVIEIRPLLLRLVKRDCIEQAYRLREQLSRIFRFAVATERAERDPAHDLRDTLPARPSLNYAHIIVQIGRASCRERVCQYV